MTSKWVITGKFTADGSNAWRRADGTWSSSLGEAGVFSDEASVKDPIAQTAATEQRLISDPYAIEVQVADGKLAPLTARERIRASGPTVRLRRPDRVQER